MTDQWAMGKEGGLIFYPLLSTQQGAGDNRKHEPRPRLLPVSQSGESQVYIPQLTSPPNASGQRQAFLGEVVFVRFQSLGRWDVFYEWLYVT